MTSAGSHLQHRGDHGPDDLDSLVGEEFYAAVASKPAV
jgi:hypothetical protein